MTGGQAVTTATAPLVPPLRRTTYRSRPTAVRLARLVGRRAVLPGLRARVSGAENVPQGPVVLVANHSRFADGPLLYAASPRAGVVLVKAEAYTGAAALLLASIGQVPVNRGRADRHALGAARAELRRGGLVALFPEGTRGDGEVLAVHDGVGWLLAHAAAPVVPVAIAHHGSPRAGVKVTVDFGPPATVAQTGPSEQRATWRAMAEQVRQLLQRHVQASRAADAPGVAAGMSG